MNVATTAKRIALIGENGLEQLHLEQQNKQQVVGNIYIGRVTNVVPGMQAAFVDLGLSKNGFIHRDDLASYQAAKGSEYANKSISHFVREGEAVLVQVVKEGIGTKGPKLTGLIELSTEALVYVPHGNYIAISKKIADENEREKWRSFGQEHRKDQEGFLFRTAVEQQSIEELTHTINQVRKTYEDLRQKSATLKVPALVYDAYDFIETTISSMLKNTVNEIVVDDFDVFQLLKEQRLDSQVTLTYYREKEGIFTYYRIEEEMEKLLKRVVWLKSGAYLVIDETEALTVIDVNTGNFTGKTSFKETALKVNTEAAIEVARQMKLRNIGGIVIVDFINMSSERDRQAVIQEMKKQVSKDEVRTTVVGFTELGLLQITRKKTNESLHASVTKPCPVCQGKGRTLDDETVIYEIERHLLQYKNTDYEAIWIETRASIIERLKKDDMLQKVRSAISMEIFFTNSAHESGTYTVRYIGSKQDVQGRMKN